MIERARSIISIMLIISFLSGIFLFWGISRHKQSLDKSILDTTGKAKKIFAQIIRNTNLIYDFQINNILKDKAIIDAFYRRDREALYAATLPVHSLLKKENPHYSNMHFHLPDGHSFLRMHKPKEFGDDMSRLRPIIMNTHEMHDTEAGYEIGKHGLFYRVVKPVFVGGDYIGALEVGIRANEVAQNIEEVLDVQVARYLSSSLANDYYRQYATDELTSGGFLINPYGDAGLFAPLIGAYDFKQQGAVFTEERKKHYLLFSAGSLDSYDGKHLARFLVVQEITEPLHEYQAYVIKSVILTILLILSAFFILYFSFGSMINKIVNLNKGLEIKVRERTSQLEAASEKLQESNAELDQIFNTAADGMRVIGVDSQMIRVNDKFAEISGMAKEELERKCCYECFQGAYCFTEECTLQRILNGEVYIELDVKKKTVSGEERTFLLTATPFKSTDGTILGVVENFKDMTERNNTFNTVKEKEEYLNAIMSTVQAGVIVTDYRTRSIVDVNPYAEALIGVEKERLQDHPVTDFIIYGTDDSSVLSDPDGNLISGDCFLVQSDSGKRHIRLRTSSVHIRGERFMVISFIDISDVKRLLENQAVDILKSKGIMTLINGEPGCYIDLPSGNRLYCSGVSIPCNAEGGDHFFIHNLSGNNGSLDGKTIISLKDQSGHEVNCILRSIYTDLIHNASLVNNPHFSMEQTVAHINSQLCHSGYFDSDDFFTSINAEIDHNTLEMTWLSTGHPPALLIRDGKVTTLAEPGNVGSNFPVPFLPEAEFKSDTIQLLPEDQILFYTDGLTDMPLNIEKSALTTEGLIQIIQDIVDGNGNSVEETLPVSVIADRILDRITESYGEVASSNGSGETKRVIPDDVSLVALQIETTDDYNEIVLNHETKEQLSDEIEKTFIMIADQCDLSDFKSRLPRVRMAFEDAVINAWRHGNGMSKEKQITIRWQFGNGLTIEVIDEGSGFDYHSLPDPTLSENILLPTGRGLFIIKDMADKVWWRANGSQIILFFQRDMMADDAIYKATDPLWSYCQKTYSFQI